MSNPFDSQDGTFLVLVNDEGQHSLWPDFARLPEGWAVALPAGPREAALAFVEEHWTDMRPAGLRAAAGAESV